MELKNQFQKFVWNLKKYRYAVIVLLIGLGLMMIPRVNSSSETSNNNSLNQTDKYMKEISLEDKLSSLLSMVEGAGDVKVVLTISAGEEIIYQENGTFTNSENSENRQSNTVTITDSGRNQTGLIKQINPAVYQGAIVICNGADIPSVRWNIVDAVSRLTGLGADRISVLKMK